MQRRTLAIAASAAAVLLLLLASAAFLVDSAQPCNAPTLPSDLESMVEVMRGASRGVHIQGTYGLLNAADNYDNALNAMTHTITLPKRSVLDGGSSEVWFRAAVSPNPYDTKLYLYRRRKSAKPSPTATDDGAQQEQEQPARTLVAASVSGGGTVEQQVFHVLPGLSAATNEYDDLNTVYELVVAYNLGWKNIQVGCPSVILELAMQSRDRMPRFSCDEGDSGSVRPPAIGTIDPQAQADGTFYFKYVSDQTAYARIGHGGSDDNNNNNNENGASAPRSDNQHFHMLAKYDIVVPHLPDRHQKWKFRASVHSNFIDGGDIGLVLLNGNFSNELRDVTPRSCDEGTHDCFYGHRAVENTAILQEQLTAAGDGRNGYYALFLVLRRSEQSQAAALAAACFPYSVTVDLFPLPSEDTFVNCDADALVPSLNVAGLYNNNTGILRYHAPVLVNLTLRRQTATLVTVHDKSILRAWTSAHGTVDVDLMLRERTPAGGEVTVAYSMASYTPDGIVAELRRGVVYELEVSYASLHRRDTGETDLDYQQLCDFFELQVHVFPVDAALNKEERDDDAAGRPLDGEAMARELRGHFEAGETTFRVGRVSYSQYDYFHKINPNALIQQETIAAFQIELPRPSLLAMTVSADAYSGTPVVEMALADGDPTDVLYARHRGVGSYLYGEFDRGVYNVTIKTPYAQREWDPAKGTWAAKVPDAAPYIPYNFEIAVGTQEICIAALPLPDELMPKSAASHHHLGDVFHIKPGFTGHDIRITAETDSVVHFVADSASQPLSVSLLRTGSDGDAGGTHHKELVVGAERLQTAHQQHGQIYELFAGIKANQAYILRIEAEGVNGGGAGGGGSAESAVSAAGCISFEMELSIAAVPPPASELPADSPLRQCEDAAGVEDFGTLTLPASATEQDVWRPNHAKGDYVVKFKLEEAAHLRMLMYYDFMEDAPQLKMCPCTDVDAEWCKAQCVTSNVFFNGLEIPTTTLMPGEYSLVLGGWAGSFGDELSGDVAPRVTGACHRFRLKLFVVPFRDKPAPPFCHVRMQHLPRSLDHVGALSAHYGSQLHYLQELKLSSEHQGDASQLTIARRSVVRVQVGANDFGVGIDLKQGWAKKSAAGAVAHLPTLAYAWNGNALYAVVEPGKYTLTADYVFEQRDGAAEQEAGCVSVPVEIAILPVEDIAARVQTGDVQSCDVGSGGGFPNLLISDASSMRYRSPDAEVASIQQREGGGGFTAYGLHPFDHTIDFVVGDEIGAFVQADVISSFEAGGLSMTLTGGELQANGDYAPNRTFPIARLSNRAALDVYLQRGRYALRVFDSVPASSYAKALQADARAVAGCTRYSLRLSTTDRGSSGPTTPPPKERPQLECNGRYDFLPDTLHVTHGAEGGNAAANNNNNNNQWGQPQKQSSGEWSVVQGGRFEIPFGSAVQRTRALGDVVMTYHTVEIVMKFDVAPGQYVRAWFRSHGSGAPSIRIVDPNGGIEPVLLARGKYFGRNTLSLSYQPGVSPFSSSSSSRQLQLVIKFAYSTLPEYGVDYTDCTGLYKESSYELTFARFPTSHLDGMVQCPAGLTSRASKLPASPLPAPGSLHDTYFVSSADIADYTKRNYGIDITKAGDHNAFSRNDFVLLPTYRHAMRVSLRSNGMYVMVFLDYNVLVTELRAVLLYAGNESVVRIGDGEPAGAVDETYDAQAFLHASALPAGDYLVVIEQANAERRIARDDAMYCIPFAAQILVGGGDDASTNAMAGKKRKPTVTLVEGPMPRDNLDVSDGLKVTVQLSEPADVQSLPRGEARLAVGQLEDAFGGEPVKPYSVYFGSDTELVLVFRSMEWNVKYQLKLKPELIRTKSGDDVFSLPPSSSAAFDVAPTFRTATCGCDAWGRCADGGACPCQEPTGARCDKCNDYAFLSTNAHPVGNIRDPGRQQLLICELTKGGWHATTEAPDTMPPRKHGDKSGTDEFGRPIANHTLPPHAVWVGPPLRFLRRFLAYGALGAIVVYVVMSLWTYRREIRQHAHNPFRVLANDDTGALGDAADDDNGAIDLESTNAVHESVSHE